MRRIVFFGKGGVGKTTTSVNISILFHRDGKAVLQIGCDPKHDSTMAHAAQTEVGTVMEAFVKQRNTLRLADLRRLIVKGRTGVHCLEIGGPIPGKGCAGRAVSFVLNFIREDKDFFKRFDVVVFDVLGDIVCGGFAAPIQDPERTDVYIVVSGELMSLFAANNIARGIRNLAPRSGARLAGVIGNMKNSFFPSGIIADFAKKLGTRVVGIIPGDDQVVLAEISEKAVVDMAPRSAAAAALAQVYRRIVATKDRDRVVPTPMDDAALKALYFKTLRSADHGSAAAKPI